MASSEFTTSATSISGQSASWLDFSQCQDRDFEVATAAGRQSNLMHVSSPAHRNSSSCTVPAVQNRDQPLLYPLSASRPDHHPVATLNSKSPAKGLLSAMEGKTWSQFIAQDRPPADSRSCSKSNDCENMKLKKEDLPIFGLCPARDQFYVTKCDHCGQVVKYQALPHHMESRHSHTALASIETPPSSTRSETSSSGSTYSLSNNLMSCEQDQQSSSAFNSLEPEFGNVTISRLTPSPGTDSPTDAVRLPLSGGQHCTSIASSTGLCINISSMSITSSPHLVDSHNLNHLSSSSSDTGLPVVTISAQHQDCSASSSGSAGISLLKPSTNSIKLKVSGAYNNNNGNNTLAVASSLTATLLTPVAGGSKKSKKSASTTSSSSSSSNLQKEKLLPCKDRQYDPDKHCGVRSDSMDKACTRSLTCKTHSLTLRRQVSSRSKPFDDLLEEHRQAKEDALRQAGKEVKLTKKQIKQREQEAKKALLAQQKVCDLKTSPASSTRPSPASSPSVATSNRQLTTVSFSSTAQQVSSLPSPGAASTSGSQVISSPSPASIMKQSLQNNLTAKIRRKEKGDLEQQSISESRFNGVAYSGPFPPPPPLTLIRNAPSLPLILRHSSSEKRSRYEGPDGIEYLKYPPRPLAVNTYNTRVRHLSSSLTFDPFNVSSRLHSRAGDSTYAAIGKIFELNSQENSVTTVASNSSSSVKSKKKKISTSSSNSNNNNTSLKLTAVDTSCGVQLPVLPSELDSSVNMASQAKTSTASHEKNLGINIAGAKFGCQDGVINKKRPAAKASISNPFLTSLLESGLNPTPSLTISLGGSNNSNNFCVSQGAGSLVSNSPLTANKKQSKDFEPGIEIHSKNVIN